ncbi:MAG: helix-turn-helix domain-containing protein [Desulfobacter sp.]|nr:MAG: helix-turn-helix domain-containing protein [Desulfobacter sp.]
MGNQNPLINVDELAAFLNVPKSKIYSLTRQKGKDSIPRYKIGRYVRFKLNEVLEWLESRKIGGYCYST